jgi:hypothetical protein
MFKKMFKRGSSMIEGVIALTIFIIVVAAVLLPQIVGTNTTGWSAGAATLWTTLQLIAVAGTVYLVYRVTSGN